MIESIIATYPGFGALPRAIKQLLLTSESFFLEDIRMRSTGWTDGSRPIVTFTLPKPAPKAPVLALHPWSVN
jgi:hypothetical protein